MLDGENIFLNNYAMSGWSTATQASEDNVDFGAGLDHLNAATVLNAGISGKHQWLNIFIGTAATSGDAATLEITLHDSADDSSFAATDPIIKTPATIAVGTLIAGYEVMRAVIPSGLRRYLQLSITVGTGTYTAGTINAWIGPYHQS